MDLTVTVFFKILRALKNRIIFLFICSALYTSCQTAGPDAEKENNAEKILETNVSFAQKQIDAGKPDQALQVLRPLLSTYPDHPMLHNMLGITYLALSRAAHARIFFEKAYKIDKNPMYALNLSSALIALGSYAKAEKILTPHVKEKKYKNIERIYHNYALTFEMRKIFNKAIRYYNKALDENPSYYLSNLRLGKIYLRMQKKTLALSNFKKSMDICRVCFEPVNDVVMIHLEEGSYAKANEVLRQFLANKEISDESKNQANKLFLLTSKVVNQK